jgi:hypothetical protein
LQHQHNPVDWYAWGPQAFEAAKSQDKPIFLSVGYSTCYWCHVMERESFENEATAAVMNEKFICIKVDREERPDVDQLYMTAVQIMTHHGGWPMSVFLLPDLRPFYGGTYFPPQDHGNRPGFVSLMNGIADAYKNRKSDVEKSADQITDILTKIAEPPAPAAAMTIDQNMIARITIRARAALGLRQNSRGKRCSNCCCFTIANLPATSARRSCCTRWTAWPTAGFAISWAGRFIATAPMPNGWCRTLRSCCTTTPCWRGFILKRIARPKTGDTPPSRAGFLILC